MNYAQIKDFVKSGDIEIKTGPFGTQLKANEYTESGTPVLNVRNLGFGNVRTDKLEFVGAETTDRLSMHLLRKGDLVFGRKGAVERHSYITDREKGWMQGSDCIRIRVNTTSINSRFLSYFFLTKAHQAYMMSACSHGTTMASLNQGILEQIVFPLPTRKTQDKIVTMLSCIDDKIELNSRINENLEQQAQAIYASMFFDVQTDGWKRGILSDITEITMGQSPSGSSYNENGSGTVFFQGRAEFGFRFPTIRLYTTEPKRMAQKNDVLMSVRAPVGDLNVAHEDCCIGRGLSAIHSKDNHQSFVLYTLFSRKKELDVFNGEGTVFGSINRDSLNTIPIIIPPTEIMDKFERTVAPMDELIFSNYDANCRLVQIKDSLLPKLMSGELNVSEVKL